MKVAAAAAYNGFHAAHGDPPSGKQMTSKWLPEQGNDDRKMASIGPIVNRSPH